MHHPASPDLALPYLNTPSHAEPLILDLVDQLEQLHRASRGGAGVRFPSGPCTGRNLDLPRGICQRQTEFLSQCFEFSAFHTAKAYRTLPSTTQPIPTVPRLAVSAPESRLLRIGRPLQLQPLPLPAVPRRTPASPCLPHSDPTAETHRTAPENRCCTLDSSPYQACAYQTKPLRALPIPGTACQSLTAS